MKTTNAMTYRLDSNSTKPPIYHRKDFFLNCRNFIIKWMLVESYDGDGGRGEKEMAVAVEEGGMSWIFRSVQ